MRESNWYGIDVCVKCKGRLSDSQIMHSDGVCPKCGHVTKGTVCETIKVVAKEIKHHKWWQFWKRKYTYKGVDDFSERWLNER